MEYEELSEEEQKDFWAYVHEEYMKALANKVMEDLDKYCLEFLEWKAEDENKTFEGFLKLIKK